MNLDRLRQVVSGAVPRVAPAAPEMSTATAEVHRKKFGESVVRIDGARVADMLAGHCVESTDGMVIVVDRYYAADRRHGRLAIGNLVDTLESGRDALAVLARAWPSRDAITTRPPLPWAGRWP